MKARAIVAAGAVVLLTAPSVLPGQQPPPRPRPDSVATRRDTLRLRRVADSLAMRDSTGRLLIPPGGLSGDSARAVRVFKWEPADSVMTSLAQRRGYAVTKYQGTNVVFRAKDHVIYLVGKPSMVQRDSATLVGDTIQFNDSTQIIIARGDTLVLRDPAQGESDLVALSLLRYDIQSKQGLVRDVTTTLESGQRWVVHGGVAAFKGDTTTRGDPSNAFFARNGWLTSCEEVEPHYHFAARELKLVGNNVMVARPAVLYIADIPVAWLPFVFQDMRSGRRSGLIPPRFGVSDIVRNSSSYRRTVEQLGYYFALTDYVDAAVTMDWRSDAGAGAQDPGWLRLNSNMNYRWRDQFIDGDVRASYHYLKNGETNQEYSIRHSQSFSQRSRITANLNYVTNTSVHRNTSFNPFQALGTIRSQLNYSTGRGPFSLALGGSQVQYPGRKEVNRDFPSINLTSKAIKAGEWLSWTPSFSSSFSQRLNIDQIGDFAYRYRLAADGRIQDSVAFKRNSSNASIRFDTPLQIFGFSLRNSFSLTSRVNDFPEKRTVFLDPRDTTSKVERIYRRTYINNLDWDFSFALPSFSQGKWSISPNLQLQKIDPRSGLLVKSERTANKWVSQGFRPAMGVSISPTFYGFLPGLGPVSRIRHAIQPGLSYQYTPRAKVSEEFLSANGDSPVGFLGGAAQNTISLSLNTTFEAKLRGNADDDTLAVGATPKPKIKLLSLNFTPLSYDFERARITKKTGLNNRTFGYTVASDLLPGLDLGVDYSLFQGDPISDTSVFKPYRESMHAQLSLGASSPIVRGVARLLGLSIESADPRTSGRPQGPVGTPGFGAGGGFEAGQPIAGSINRASSLQIPSGQGWSLNLSFSATRQRPPVGSNVLDLDPTRECLPFKNLDPFTYQTCVNQRNGQAGTESTPFENTTRGGTFFRLPPQQTSQGSFVFHLTDKWAAQWSTTYDFVEKQFASQIVSLQREMHDWDAIFAFTKAPNGNFAFNFFIALKAEPDLKFNYDRRDYPRGYSGIRTGQ